MAPQPRPELANAILGAVLAHTRQVAGDDGVARVLAEAGERRSVAEIEDPVGWSSYQQGLALFQAAARVLGDPDVGRKAGAQVMRRYHGTETVTLLRSFGSPAELLRVYPAISAKQTAVTRAEVVEVGERHALITMTTAPPIERDPHFCGYTMGAIAEFPTLFGMDEAEVDELQCQAHGAARCLLRVTWDPTSSVKQSLEEEVAELRTQVAALATRYESLEAAAMELSSARDVESMLEVITRRAGMAVRAPRYLLVARLPRDRSWRVHHVGFTDAEASAAADRVLQADPSGADAPEDGSAILVEVASSRAHFGRLAAFHPPGLPFLPHERVLLAAYAGHAAAALETAAALDEARERNHTLGTLLSLGTALSEATSRGEVAERLADALADILACDEAHVLLWDAGDAALTRAASAGPGLMHRPLPTAARLREPLVVPRLTVTPGPTVVSPMSDAVARRVLSLVGLDTAVLVPIVAHGTLFGVAATAWTGPLELTETARERLTGIASLAATACTSADLLDEARHQALHDPLTDLPNPRLFEERLVHALPMARRTGAQLAVLFLDLDLFKVVNDTHGHSTGDELLRAVADRLRASVRRDDTVARVGGDEFAILLQNVGSPARAERVAASVVATLQRPFPLRAATVTIGASVGVAICPEPGDTHQSVLARADAAMYQAKATGRGRYHVAPAESGSGAADGATPASDGATPSPDGFTALVDSGAVLERSRPRP